MLPHLAALMRRHVLRLAAVLVLFFPLPGQGPQQGSQQDLAPADAPGGPAITITPYWDTYDSPWTVSVGYDERHRPYWIDCTGAQEMTIELRHTNNEFIFDEPPATLVCGNPWPPYVTWKPTAPGFAYDHVTISSASASTSFTMVGLGIATTKADYWQMDLGDNVSPNGILYDEFRDRVYVSSQTQKYNEWPPSDEVLVVSPASRSVLARIKTGSHPAEMVLSPDGKQLYVANSGEPSLSVISPDALIETARIPLPNLHPTSKDPYYPRRLAWIGDHRLWIASLSPGLATGGPVYELDLETLALTERTDTGFPYGFDIAGSRDRQSAALLNGPFYSSSDFLRYDAPTDSMVATQIDETGKVSIDNNGARLFTSWHYPAYANAPIRIYDQELRLRAKLDATHEMVTRVLANPVMPNLLYAIYANNSNLLVWRADLRRQVAEYTLDLPFDTYATSLHMAVSGDGEWLYVPIARGNYWPPAKLAAIHLGRPPYSDSLPPSSTVHPLAAAQTKNYWIIEWQGADAGSGIDHFEVWSREEEGPWRIFVETPNTSALFVGARPDQEYCFRVAAVDRAGNVELFRPGPDTCTVAGSDGSGLRQSWLPAVSGYR